METHTYSSTSKRINPVNILHNNFRRPQRKRKNAPRRLPQLISKSFDKNVSDTDTDSRYNNLESRNKNTEDKMEIFSVIADTINVPSNITTTASTPKTAAIDTMVISHVISSLNALSASNILSAESNGQQETDRSSPTTKKKTTQKTTYSEINNQEIHNINNINDKEDKMDDEKIETLGLHFLLHLDIGQKNNNGMKNEGLSGVSTAAVTRKTSISSYQGIFLSWEYVIFPTLILSICINT